MSSNEFKINRINTECSIFLTTSKSLYMFTVFTYDLFFKTLEEINVNIIYDVVSKLELISFGQCQIPLTPPLKDILCYIYIVDLMQRETG